MIGATMRCPECGAMMYETTEEVCETIRGVETRVSGILHWSCGKCGNAAYRPREADELAAAQLDQVSHAKGLLGPSEILDLRKRLGLTQAQFEKLLGVSSPTCSRWENGVMLQSGTADRLMRMYMRHPMLATSHTEPSVVVRVQFRQAHKNARKINALRYLASPTKKGIATI